MHVAEQFVDPIPVLDVGKIPAPGAIVAHIGGVGVAKEVVHVAQNFLVGADQEHPQQVVLTGPRRVHRQAGLDAALVHVMVDAPVRVAGQVADQPAPVGALVQP